MTKQVRVFFFPIKTYRDEVLCNVALMSANHVLLKRSWQFNKEVTYNGQKNTYTFMLNRKKVNLLPLNSRQVRKDQLLSQQKEVKLSKRLMLAKKKKTSSKY